MHRHMYCYYVSLFTFLQLQHNLWQWNIQKSMLYVPLYRFRLSLATYIQVDVIWSIQQGGKTVCGQLDRNTYTAVNCEDGKEKTWRDSPLRLQG